MIPTYMSSSSSPPFPFDLNYSSGDQFHDDDDDQNPNLNYFSSSFQASSSSSHLFLNPTRDQHQLYHAQIYQPHAQNTNDNCGSYDMEGNKGQGESGHNNNKLSLLWRKEEKYEGETEKVMLPAAKMKLVKKVKKNSSDRVNMEDQKGPLSSSSLETTDHSSNNSSYSNNGGNNNVPLVRVCSDCNTTKTPLWRSGPNGPKSLCNACGIRQRKARRAMAAAAAGTTPSSSSPTTLKLKVQKTAAKSNYPLKKRCKFIAEATAEAPSRGQAKKKHAVEDFLMNLSNSLVLHHGVFPQDEKDAAILLMAISCGLVHG